MNTPTPKHEAKLQRRALRGALQQAGLTPGHISRAVHTRMRTLEQELTALADKATRAQQRTDGKARRIAAKARAQARGLAKALRKRLRIAT